MSRMFYHVMQDNAGNLLFDVSGTMRLAGSGALATIYGDEALTVILPNPMTNHPSFGSFKCFLAVGDYDFYMAKAGYTFETLTGVQGSGTMADQNASAVAVTGGSVADVTVARLYGAAATPTFGTEIGLGTAPVAGYSLTAAFHARFNSHVGIAAAPLFPLHVLGEAYFNNEVGMGQNPVAGYSLVTQFGCVFNGNVGIAMLPVYALDVTGQARLNHEVGIGAAPQTGRSLVAQFASRFNSAVGIQGDSNAGRGLTVRWSRATQYGTWYQPLDADTGQPPVVFTNLASGSVGSIDTSATTTTYNTTSDARLKEFTEALVGALDVVRALRPISFRWRSDGSVGHGFLANEVATVVPGVITGEPDEVNSDGTIKPQQIDHSKLVVWLVGACQALAARVEALEARLPA